MPYKEYICPDEHRCLISDCLNGCRMASEFPAHRCMSKRILSAISQQREWKGTPSATQLLNGTREEYLKIKKFYPVNPQDQIPAIFGTGVHAFLEEHINGKQIAEERLTSPDGSYTGQFDCYDSEEQILYDTKTYGSFKTAHLLGLVKHEEPILDSEGNQRKYKNGRKMVKRWWTRDGHRSNFDVAVQLNAYRIMVEAAGHPVKEMMVEIITRDAYSGQAVQRGVTEASQLAKINPISDRWVTRFMATKSKRLRDAINNDIMPAPCSYRETWGGLKCQKYCNVWMFCELGREAHRDKKWKYKK